MTTITITDIADLRVGDIATLRYKGHEFTGEVWAGAHGELFLGLTIVHYSVGYPSPSLTLISATREVPDLPTQLGSVIANVVLVGGYYYDWAMLTDPKDDSGQSWIACTADVYAWVRADLITSWTPCTVEVQEDTD